MNPIVHSKKLDRNLTLYLRDNKFTEKVIREGILNNSENFNTSDIEPAVDLIMTFIGNKGIPNSEYTFNLRFNDLGELYIFNICINLKNG